MPPVPTWFDRLAAAAASALLGVGLAGIVLSWLGWYQSAVVLLVGIAAGYTLFSVREGFEEGERWSFAHSAPALAALLAAVAAAAFIGNYSSEPLLPGDAAAEVLIDAELLATEGSARIDGPAPEWGAGEFLVAAPGYQSDDLGRLTSSSPPFAAAVTGSLAWIGTEAMLWSGAIMAAIALVGLYAFAARLLRPWTAVAVTVALAVNPAFVHLARDGSVAAAALALLFGGLALLWDDEEQRRPRRGLLAGVLLGGTAVAGYEWLLLAIPLAALMAHDRRIAGAAAWTEKRRLRRFSALVIAGFLPMAVFAAAAAARTGDLIDRSGVQPGWLVFGVVLAVAVGAVMPVARPGSATHRRIVALVGAAALLALGGYLGLLRPVTTTATGSPSPAIAEAQAAEGVAVDATRTYAEESGLWLAWYAGPVGIGAGVAGWAVLVGIGAAGEGARRRPLVFVFLTVSVIWLLRPGVVPIQPEVMARFLPLTLVGLLLGAGWLAERLWRWQRPLVEVAQVVAIGIMAGAIAFPIWFLTDTWDLATQRGARDGVEALCPRIGPDAAVVVSGGGAFAESLPVTVRVFCDLPAVSSDGPLAPADVRVLGAGWEASGRTLVVLGADGQGQDRPVVISFASLERRVEGRPRAAVATSLDVYVRGGSG